MRIYNEYADWFHLLTHPSEYAEEAADYVRLIEGACPDARTLLEMAIRRGQQRLPHEAPVLLHPHRSVAADAGGVTLDQS